MAVLSDSDRLRIERGFQRFMSKKAELMPYTSPELRTAINETDDWIEANQASYNAALSGAFAANASASQKALLFMAVTAMRYDLNSVKSIIGEVD